MRSKRFPTGLRATLVMLTVVLLVTTGWAATEKVLHNFGSSGTDGMFPTSGLIRDAAGNLYGTTQNGGSHYSLDGDCFPGCGTVFELMPREGGGWTERVLHNFGSGMDGVNPNGALIFDAAGNLYGTTTNGGTEQLGTVFKLTPNGSGGWTEKILHNFKWDFKDGSRPIAGLIFDAAGNLYGTTQFGGHYGYWDGGIVFEITPNESGGWTEKVLHSFGGGRDGVNPSSGLMFDGAGNLYGTTQYGGTYRMGIVFEMTPNDNGSWSEKRLHDFGPAGLGPQPFAGLIFDAAGNLYGVTSSGGGYDCGTVFGMTPNGSGGWTEKILHNFHLYPMDGCVLYGGLVFDAAGNLYGTAYRGGYNYRGTVFELTPRDGGGWTERNVHYFGYGMDGVGPYGNVIFDAAGNLYGTTAEGGAYNRGTVFEITP